MNAEEKFAQLMVANRELLAFLDGCEARALNKRHSFVDYEQSLIAHGCSLELDLAEARVRLREAIADAEDRPSSPMSATVAVCDRVIRSARDSGRFMTRKVA